MKNLRYLIVFLVVCTLVMRLYETILVNRLKSVSDSDTSVSSASFSREIPNVFQSHKPFPSNRVSIQTPHTFSARLPIHIS